MRFLHEKEMSVSGRIVRNTLFNSASRVCDVIFGLILTPLVIRRLGLELFGVWVMIIAVTNYFSLFDFGIGSSSVKYVAEYHARGMTDRINRLVSTGLFYYACFAVVVAALALLLTGPFLLVFKIPAQHAAEASFVLMIVSLTLGFNNIVANFTAIQTGLQRMDITALMGISSSCVSAGVTLLMLKAGHGLTGLIVANAAVYCSFGLLNIAIAFRLVPGLRLGPAFVDRAMLRQMFGFGSRIQVTSLAGLLHSQFDKFLLASLVDLTHVSFYGVASQVVGKARSLPQLVVSALFPAASDLEAHHDRAGLEELYRRAFKYTALIALPCAVFLLLIARVFIAAWLGPGYGVTAATLRALAVANCFNALIAPGFFILNGMGKPGIGMKSSLAAAGLNLVLSSLGVAFFGYPGVVAGTLVAMTAAAVYFLVMCHRALGIPFVPLIARPLAAAMLPCLVMGFTVRFAQGWPGVIGCAVSYAVLYVACVAFLKCLDPVDLSLPSRVLAGATPEEA